MQWLIQSLCVLLIYTVACSEDYAQWAHASSLYLNTKASGANVPGTVYDFPVLVKLNKSNFNFTEAKAGGVDLRFSRSDGRPLAYEIEVWSDTRSLAEIWVKVDTLLGNNDTQFMKMYWGKSDAADSSNGKAVFDSTNGFVGVWHLGGNPAAVRKNSVAGGADAVPNNYDGNENTVGMIGLADSLDGDSTGDFLDIGDGYSDFTSGFTFSIWVYPTALKQWARLLDIGNGQESDNISFTRGGNSQNIILESWTGAIRPPKLQINNAYPLNEWQHFTGTITGKKYAIYRNGILIGENDSGNAVTKIKRLSNFLGKSNWGADQYYQGIYDEAVMSKVTRSADWIKLTYANQGPPQSLVTFTKPGNCQSDFSISSDTTLSEAHLLTLQAHASCATGFYWTAISGPTPRILDPEALALQIILPRIPKDTVLVYQFQGYFAGIWDSLRVNVSVVNSIPDPVFTLPVLETWNGKDTVWVRPSITNMTAIKASAEPDLNFHWSLTQLEADTTMAKDYLILNSSPVDGSLRIQLCLDNNGPQACQSTEIKVSHPVGIHLVPKHLQSTQTGAKAFEANGRLLSNHAHFRNGLKKQLHP